MTQVATMLLIQIAAVSATALNLPTVNLPLPTLSSDVRVTDLRCEYLCDPLGIDVTQPRLSWKLQSAWRGQTQIAYQILVAAMKNCSVDNRADLWNTGKETIRPVDPGRLCRPTADVARALLLEDPVW
jgi:hypothetical protein